MAKIELTPSQIAFAQSDDDTYEAPSDEELGQVEEQSFDDMEEPEVEEPSADENWVDDEVKEFAAGYGLEEEALSDFSSKEELERFGRLTDQRAREQARFSQFQQEAPRDQPTEEQGEAEAEKKQDEEFELFDPQHLVDENYDETTVKLGKALRATQEQVQRLQAPAPEEPSVEQEALFAKSFHEGLDQLDRSLFGNVFDDKGEVGVISNPHDLNRRAVWEAASQIQASLPPERRNLPVNMLVKRAVNMVFGDVLVKERESGGRDRAANQSRKRRPTSSSRGMNRTSHMSPQQQDAEDAAAIANSPELKKFWAKSQRENGVV